MKKKKLLYKNKTEVSGKRLENATRVYNTLMNLGVSPIHAAGILGNIAVESGYDDEAANGQHYGLLQNDRNIRNGIIKQYGNGYRDSQLKFISDLASGNFNMKDIQNRYNQYAKGQYETPQEAAAAWHRIYERAPGQADKLRQSEAQAVYDYFYTPELELAAQEPEIVAPVDNTRVERPQIMDVQYMNNTKPKIDISRIPVVPTIQSQFTSHTNMPQTSNFIPDMQYALTNIGNPQLNVLPKLYTETDNQVSFTPGVGTVLDAADIVNDVQRGTFTGNIALDALSPTPFAKLAQYAAKNTKDNKLLKYINMAAGAIRHNKIKADTYGNPKTKNAKAK